MPCKAVCAQQIYLSHKMPQKWWGASLSDPFGTEVEYSVSIMNRALPGGWKIFSIEFLFNGFELFMPNYLFAEREQ